ncbi:MAG: MauE/DoxX family redox-associated membrane protein [Planctomycetota bacterium]
MPSEASKPVSTLSLIARILLGLVFVIAATNKLVDPGSLAAAIDKFAIPGLTVEDAPWLVKASAYFVPWLELAAALALIAGLWTRAAATILTGMLVAFSVAIWSAAIDRGLSFDCGCFGDLKGFCTGDAGWCNVIQNGVLAGFGIIALAAGGGRASADALLCPDRGPDDDAGDGDIDFA